MKEHEESARGNVYSIRITANGYIFTYRDVECVFTSFTEVVNYLASCAHLTGIGEKLELISNRDGKNE